MPTDQFVTTGSMTPRPSPLFEAGYVRKDHRQSLPGTASIAAGLLFRAVLNGAAGYFVGQRTGEPVVTTVASVLFGLPGMLVATVYAVRENGR